MRSERHGLINGILRRTIQFTIARAVRETNVTISPASTRLLAFCAIAARRFYDNLQ
jgi:hypothetical protein